MIETLTEIEKAELQARKTEAERLGKDTIIKYNDEYISICKQLQPNFNTDEIFIIKALLYTGIEKIYKEEATEEIKGVLWKYIDKRDLKALTILIYTLLEK